MIITYVISNTEFFASRSKIIAPLEFLFSSHIFCELFNEVTDLLMGELDASGRGEISSALVPGLMIFGSDLAFNGGELDPGGAGSAANILSRAFFIFDFPSKDKEFGPSSEPDVGLVVCITALFQQLAET